MNAITQHYVIDLSSNNNFVQVPAVQGDGNVSRYVEIELIDHGIDYVIDPEESDVTIAGTKPDGKEIWNTCTITNEGYILVELTYQMLAVPGRGVYQILIFSKGTNNQLKSFPFYILVVAATYDPGLIISDDEFEALIQYTQEAKEAADKAEEAIEIVDAAVEHVDEVAADIYEKYDDIIEAKNTAVAAASSASTSATNAATSETNAANSASAAATSETNAATSETNAANSASAAATSATNAATSETNAANSATNAAASATNAANSATAADSSAEDAEAWAIGKRDGVDVGPTDETYQNNSKYYAGQAGTSASNAATSESNASTSATNAATSETNAATSESNAADSATLAESWAVGGTGTRAGEDYNNAEYWCHQAESIVGIDEFVGATENTDGVRGIVPAPIRGQQNHVIMGDGAWKKLNYTFIGTTAEWTAETNKSFYQIVMLTDD